MLVAPAITSADRDFCGVSLYLCGVHQGRDPYQCAGNFAAPVPHIFPFISQPFFYVCLVFFADFVSVRGEANCPAPLCGQDTPYKCPVLCRTWSGIGRGKFPGAPPLTCTWHTGNGHIIPGPGRWRCSSAGQYFGLDGQQRGQAGVWYAVGFPSNTVNHNRVPGVAFR